MSTVTQKRRKKVLLVITKASVWGGAQRYVFDLATNLSSEDFEVAVVLGGEGPLKDRLLAHNVRVISIPHMQRDMNLVKEVRSLFELISIFKSEAPDVVHLNSSKAGGLGGVAARVTRVPLIIFTAHAWAFNEGNRPTWHHWLITPFVWLTIMLSHKTICVSHKTKQDIVGLPWVRKRCEVIHNGTKAFSYLERSAARTEVQNRLPQHVLDQTRPWLVTIAELHPSKGHRYLLEALAKLEQPYYYFLIGEGELKEQVHKQIHELQLADSVFWLGLIPDAPTLLKAFDVFVLPSTTEALSLSVLEAGQAGLPVIASRVGGVPEIIDNERSGLLTKARSAQELEQALKTLLNNKQLWHRYGQALQQKVEKDFSIATMTHKTGMLYQSDNKS